MNGFEVQRFAMQFRRRDPAVAALKFPGKGSRVIVVVAQCFPIRRLMFFPKMGAARFVAGQRVDAHQLGKFQKIGDAPRALKRLIEILAIARNANFPPKLCPQIWNFSEGFLESGFVSRHATFIPKKFAELAMK